MIEQRRKKKKKIVKKKIPVSRITLAGSYERQGDVGLFERVPLDVLTLIFNFLPFKAKTIAVLMVGKSWRSLLNHGAIWHHLVGTAASLMVLPRIPANTVRSLEIGTLDTNQDTAANVNLLCTQIIKNHSPKAIILSGSKVSKKLLTDNRRMFSNKLEIIVLHDIKNDVNLEFMVQNKIFKDLSSIKKACISICCWDAPGFIDAILSKSKASLEFLRVGDCSGNFCNVFQNLKTYFPKPYSFRDLYD